MIEKLKGIQALFGNELPSRDLFFATRQTYQFITPAFIKQHYNEPMLGKAYVKFKQDYEEFLSKNATVVPAKEVPVKAASPLILKGA